RELDEEEDVEALQEERVSSDEVALKDARRMRPQKSRPARLLPPRRGLDPGLMEDRPDRARGQRDPETDQLPLDPPVTPTRVLPCEPNDKLPDLDRCRRPARAAMRTHPPARAQLPMPAQKRARPHEQRRLPCVSR